MSTSPPLLRSYALASAQERAQLLTWLRQQLPHHFPTLPAAAWLRALFEFQPTLVLTTPTAASLELAELRQLVQHLAAQPELAPLNPPIHGLSALALAQHRLQLQDLLAAALPEAVAGAVGPRLTRLLLYLGQGSPLAEQIIQDQRWDLPTAPALLPALAPSGGPVPGSAEATRYLAQLRKGSSPAFPP